MSDLDHDKAFHNYDYQGREPVYIEMDQLTDREKELLITDKHFCMLPWIHLHGYPDGRAYPCCTSDYSHPVGNLNKNSLKEVWNDDPMKTVRLNMLNKINSPACKNCYEEERHGIHSMRNSFNKHFGHHINEVLDNTDADGTANLFKFRYYDIRFSNLCNMKCRTCGDTFSSLWADENKKRFEWANNSNPALDTKIMYSGRHETDMLEQLDDHIPYVEQIYFAGGEPLVMPEHYKLVRTLIDREMFNVRLTYNTNFLKVDYGKHNILQDWKLFKSVSVGASLDIDGARAEYMRKGTKWDTIVNNRKKMIEICPDVDFYVSATISLYNVLTICDFHKSWVEQELIRPDCFHLNMLNGPVDRRIDVLPAVLKDQARAKILKHIEWLKTQGKPAMDRCIPEYQGVLTMMYADDKTHQIPEFYRINEPLDVFREEKFDDIFPELKEMRKYQQPNI